jgi:hypothetical protein
MEAAVDAETPWSLPPRPPNSNCYIIKDLKREKDGREVCFSNVKHKLLVARGKRDKERECHNYNIGFAALDIRKSNLYEYLLFSLRRT